MNNTELAYLAGFLDGEGCIHIVSTKGQAGFKNLRYRLRIHITNTDKGVMDWLKQFGFYIRELKKLKKHWKQCWRADLCDTKARLLLEQLLPYLIVKKDETLLAIEFQTHKEKVGTSNGSKGMSEEEIEYRERTKKQLSELKEQKI